MIDPDLKIQLDQINQSLVTIGKNKTGGIWRSFFNGMFGALGYVAGIALVIVILYFVLQYTGQLKPFQDRVNNFTNLMDSAGKLFPAEKSTAPSSGATGGETTVTLPNGQQIQVQLPSGY